MYRTVIICLIVIGCVGAISPYHNRIVRDTQGSTKDFIYPTYPEYQTGVLRPDRDVEKVEENKAPEDTSKFFNNLQHYGKQFGSYALHGIAVVLMSTSFAYLLCGYTTICHTIKSMISKEETARAIADQPYLEDLVSKVYAAMEKYTKMHDDDDDKNDHN